jgi:hypothetical protein
MLGHEFRQRPAQAVADAAIRALTAALRGMTANHPLRTDILALLGAAFLSMAQFDVASVPVHELVDILSAAENLPSPDPVGQALRLSCYGMALHWQAIQDHDYAGFPAAVARVRHAAEVLPGGHELHSYLLVVLAGLLADQYDYVGDLETLDVARRYLTQAEDSVKQAGGPLYNPAAC